MFIIFGNRVTKKWIGKTKKYKCTRCNNSENWDVIKETHWIAFFFIPMIPYSIQYYEKCPICGGYNILSKEEALQCAEGD